MTSRRRKKSGTFAWFTALMFNVLLGVFGFVSVRLIAENNAAMGEEYITSSEALAATRERMAGMFSALVPEGADARDFWSSEVNKQIRANDLVSARGLLMAAPDMLDRKDSAAVLAAANTERSGTLDQRLLSAATLFLPDDVRARYERATTPGRIEILTTTPESDAEPVPEATEPEDSGNETESEISEAEQASANPAFFVLGSERDLAYQSAGWLRGDRTDEFSLALSGLGLAAQKGRYEQTRLTENALRGASLVKAARRAGRLQPELSDSLEKKLEAALPADRLKAELDTSFNQGGSILIQGDAILDAFVRATDEPRVQPFLDQLERISRLQEKNTNSAALLLLETLSSQRDLKRAELLIRAGGDRAIALSKYYGPEALTASQTVMDWTLDLILMIMASVGVLLLLIWLAVSTFLRSLKHGDRYSHSYGYR